MLLRSLKSIPRRITASLAAIHRRDRLFFPAVAVIGLSLALLQAAGGAWDAEFDGYPDESSHFVTGRMIWEYLTTLPCANPISWAAQYYLHYPKIGLGHWPPGYHLAEAFWSLVFGSSRISAMGLQWFVGVAALTGFYLLLRPRLPLAVTFGVLILTGATPAFQQGLEQTMSDLPCLLCVVLFMHAMVRLLEQPSLFASYIVLFAIMAASGIKGTAVCLVPVPFVALLADRRRIRVRLGWHALAAFFVLAICLFGYLSTTNVLYWGGIGMATGMPWPISNLGALAGWGFVALAVCGLRREPLPIIAGSITVCMILISLAVRALNEPRHWIIVLPAILVLSGFALKHLPLSIAALLILPAVALFPWSWYRQSPGGYRDLVRQLHLPTRMMVSSARGGSGEGAWIAEVSIAERYPASLVARSSKVLAQSGWNGEHYKLLVETPAAAARRLDEIAIDVVILDEPLVREPPHHALLWLAVTGNSAWRPCGSAKLLVAYCRASPPAFPRKPLVLNAGGWHIEERIGPNVKAKTVP